MQFIENNQNNVAQNILRYVFSISIFFFIFCSTGLIFNDNTQIFTNSDRKFTVAPDSEVKQQVLVKQVQQSLVHTGCSLNQ